MGIIGALLLLGLSISVAAAQDAIRLTRNIPGDSKPIVLYADGVATWAEGGQRVVLLGGKVLVEHGLFHLRCREAVVWVDEDAFKRTRIQRVQLYVEGDVSLEDGTKVQRGPNGLIELFTRGELKLKAQGSKINQRPQLQDPLYLRGLAERSGTAAGPKGANKVQPASYQEKNGAAKPVAPPAPQPMPAPPPPVPQPTPAAPPPQVMQEAPPPTPPSTSMAGAIPSTSNQQPSANSPSMLPVPPSAVPLPPRPGTTGGPAGMLVPRAPAPGVPRIISIAPRTSRPFEQQSFTLPSGEKAVVVTGGIILVVRNMQSQEIVDIEADRLVFWTTGNTEELFGNMRRSQGQASRELEFFLAGNVEIRQQSQPTDQRVMRADEVYYDVGRNVAVAVSADLELKRPGLADPLHLKADELLQLSPTMYEAVRAEVFSSKTPSDPGLKITMAQATIEQRQEVRRTVFGTDIPNARTGVVQAEPLHYFRGTSVAFEVEDVPFFYLPFVQGNVEKPFGPLVDFNIGYSRIFGFRVGAAFDIYDLFGLTPIEGTRWRLDVDYLSKRGPAAGTEFDYAGCDLFGINGRYNGLVKAWGISDDGEDILGPFRNDEPHPNARGRVLWRHDWWELPDGFSVKAQASVLSDRNFLEQFYKNEFDTEIDQDTFLYVKQQQGSWAWTGLADVRINDWVTKTEWLPRLDGYALGLSPFDYFTYNVHGSAGYARLLPTEEGSPVVQPTQVRLDTARFDLWQELSLPFYAGPVKVVPYGVLDLTHYTEDLTGDDRGRFYGGGGVRGSMPLSRLYPSVCSELWNLSGLYHKIVLGANYYAAHSDTPFTDLPQLDELHDDATDQAIRDITPLQTQLNAQAGLALATSPLYNPQTYAIRRLVMNRIDTLDTIQVLQMDVRQRLQTKRGYPGMQHVIDWMTLETSASYFPDPARDNFGQSFSFFEYNYVWNVGDRTALVSEGWFDPFGDGARVWSVGGYLNRPDRTTFYLGYRQIEPLNSQAVSGAATYIFSPKYAMTASAVYDFGIQESMSNSIVLTRMGSDIQVSLGLTWNALQNDFGAVFTIVPNLVSPNFLPGQRGLGVSQLGR
ncbi:MAG: hypothetical protein JNM56_38640 [Planctomycetia bacterium]|nr:hypothetical protein [Planctomycetia bacterium]